MKLLYQVEFFPPCKQCAAVSTNFFELLFTKDALQLAATPSAVNINSPVGMEDVSSVKPERAFTAARGSAGSTGAKDVVYYLAGFDAVNPPHPYRSIANQCGYASLREFYHTSNNDKLLALARQSLHKKKYCQNISSLKCAQNPIDPAHQSAPRRMPPLERSTQSKPPKHLLKVFFCSLWRSPPHQKCTITRKLYHSLLILLVTRCGSRHVFLSLLSMPINAHAFPWFWYVPNMRKKPVGACHYPGVRQRDDQAL